jgi:hypothetical protein
MKLVQKQFPKGSREFEIIDDAVYVRIKGLLKEEKSTVALSMLDPEPIVNGSELEFHGRSRRGPLLSLLMNKPDVDEFNRFVLVLKQKISGNEDALAGIEAGTARPDAPGWNVYDEPPEFDEPGGSREKTSFEPLNPERVAEDITMLKTYLDEDDIRPLLDSLEVLMAEPANEAAFQKMMDVYNAMGVKQGAVLTYAPYLKVILSRSVWS